MVNHGNSAYGKFQRKERHESLTKHSIISDYCWNIELFNTAFNKQLRVLSKKTETLKEK